VRTATYRHASSETCVWSSPVFGVRCGVRRRGGRGMVLLERPRRTPRACGRPASCGGALRRNPAARAAASCFRTSRTTRRVLLRRRCQLAHRVWRPRRGRTPCEVAAPFEPMFRHQAAPRSAWRRPEPSAFGARSCHQVASLGMHGQPNGRANFDAKIDSSQRPRTAASTGANTRRRMTTASDKS